jgi:transposase
VSDVCDEYQLSPTLFYEWQKRLMENAVVALEAGPKERTSQTQALEKKIENLEGKLAHKDSVMAELLSEYVALKSTWGALTGRWVPHDTRDEVVDFVVRWSEKCEQPAPKLVGWLGETEIVRDTGGGRRGGGSCGHESSTPITRTAHAAFFFGRPLPRFALTPLPLAALVVFAEPLLSAG